VLQKVEEKKILIPEQNEEENFSSPTNSFTQLCIFYLCMMGYENKKQMKKKEFDKFLSLNFNVLS